MPAKRTFASPCDIRHDPMVHAIDSYFVWAYFTDGEGIAFQRNTNPRLQKPIQLTLEMARDESTLPRIYRQRVPRAHKGHRFCTTTVPWDALKDLFNPRWRHLAGIRHFELGMAIATPDDHSAEFFTPGALDGDVVAFIDYGCPFAHEHFRDSNGKSRIKAFWDQEFHDIDAERGRGLPWRQPKMPGTGAFMFRYGGEITYEDINKLFVAHTTSSGAVDEYACYEAVEYKLMRDSASHGAHVMDSGAGWPDPLDPASWKEGAARDRAGAAQILFVQLPRSTVADASGGAMNVYVLDALRYVMARTKPTANVVVNLSFGSFAGPHDGSSLIERAIDDCIAERGSDRFKVILPAGNSFDAACHAQFELTDANPTNTLQLEVLADDPTDSFVEIWYRSDAEIQISIKPPFESRVISDIGPDSVACWHPRTSRKPLCWVVHVAEQTEQSPEAGGRKNNCATIVVAPTHWLPGNRSEAPYGIWEIIVESVGTNPVTVDAWVERDDPILDVGFGARQSRFVVDPQYDERVDYPDTQPVTKRGTLNSIATGARAIAVGGCLADRDQLAQYTTAGPGRNDMRPCGPNFVAPVDRREVLQGRLAAGNRTGVTVRMNGTSVAAPQAARRLLESNTVTLRPPPSNASRIDKLRWGAGSIVGPETDD